MAFLSVEADDDDDGVMFEDNVGGLEFGVGMNDDVGGIGRIGVLLWNRSPNRDDIPTSVLGVDVLPPMLPFGRPSMSDVSSSLK